MGTSKMRTVLLTKDFKKISLVLIVCIIYFVPGDTFSNIFSAKRPLQRSNVQKTHFNFDDPVRVSIYKTEKLKQQTKIDQNNDQKEQDRSDNSIHESISVNDQRDIINRSNQTEIHHHILQNSKVLRKKSERF